MEQVPGTSTAERKPTIEELRKQLSDAEQVARAAHDGLASGATSEGDLDLAYRNEADAKAALDEALAQQNRAQ